MPKGVRVPCEGLRLSTKLKYYFWHLQEWVRAIGARRNIQRIISRSIPTCKESWKLQSASQWMHLDIDFTFTIMLMNCCNFTLMVGILPQSFWCKHLGDLLLYFFSQSAVTLSSKNWCVIDFDLGSKLLQVKSESDLRWSFADWQIPWPCNLVRQLRCMTSWNWRQY